MQRKVLQPCDGPPLLRAMYFATVVWPTSRPSLSSSPWMRARPRAGWPGSCPGSADGSPTGRSVSRRAVWISNARMIEIQHGANEPRSQAGRWPVRLQCQERGGIAQQIAIGRKYRKQIRFGELRRSTLICCRRTRISPSSRARERNKPMSAVHNRMKTSTIGHEHHLIRQPYRFSTGTAAIMPFSTFGKDGIAKFLFSKDCGL